ncbi:Extracellular serine protease [Alcanivorax sp. ALC70]|nr:Extracellular serine protease [Alcanivorax sp. ALC70]
MTTTSLASRLLVGIGLLAPIATPVGAESIDVGDRETVAAAGGTRPSPWQAGSFLRIGGELIVGAGGTVENGQGYIGSDFTNGATGSATVTGTDALWANSDVLYVGDLSDGVLDIEDGGRVTALQTYIGSDLGDGQVVLSGDGSRLDAGNTLSVGEIGPGTLTLGAGTTVTNDIGYVGSFVDGEGLVQVQGGRWENRSDLVVGGDGDGEVIVGAGGTVISDNGFVGSGAGGQGRVSLGGADARWEMASNLVVGSLGSGEITVNAGATLSNGLAFVGSEAGSSGSVTVLGNGALWNNRGAILLGNNGNGELTIADGGTVRANGVVIGVSASGTGSLTLSEGGTLETPWVDRDAGTGTFYFDGGRLLASSDQDRLFLNFNDGDVVIRAGGAIIDSNGHDLIINTALDGDGGLTKAGTGTLVLNGNNLFRGASRVDGGALIVNGAVAGSTVTVADGALLGGTGTLGGARLTDGATLAPGNSIGTLTVDGDLVFESGSVFMVEGAGDGSADRVRVTGAATLNGGSVAHIDAGGDYQPFTRYTLIDADQGVTGRFDQVSTNLAFLQPLLDYDSNTVSLRLVRNDATFAGMARTANQSAAANAAEQRGIGDPVHDALLLQAADGAAVRDAFDQLAGAVYASTRAALIEDSRFLRQAAGDRLRATQGPGAPAPPCWPATRTAAPPSGPAPTAPGRTATRTAAWPAPNTAPAACSWAPTPARRRVGAWARWPATARPGWTWTAATTGRKATTTTWACSPAPAWTACGSAWAWATAATKWTPNAGSPSTATRAAPATATTPPPPSCSPKPATASTPDRWPWNPSPAWPGCATRKTATGKPATRPPSAAAARTPTSTSPPWACAWPPASASPAWTPAPTAPWAGNAPPAT